ncbi:MAG: AMP-binding protein [Acidobacteria bacterium]|nr:AMP-binding protein [Acidobacteriota bacterium]
MPNLSKTRDNSKVPRDTLIDFFRELAAIRANFLVYDDGYRVRSYTYGEVGRAARGFARRLDAAGLQKGDTVVFWGENRPEWLACYWGCLIAGIIVVPIDYRSSVEFVAKIRALVHARVVLVGDDVQTHADPPKFDGAEQWRFADIDWRSDGPMPPVAVSRDDVIQIVFTSGATAEPKGVVIRHRNVLANIVPVEREITKYRRYARPFHPLRFLNLLPLSHMFGQSMATTIPPMVRGTVIFTRSFNPRDLVRLIRSRRVSVLVCVPKILDVLRDHIARTCPESTESPPAGISIPGRWWKYRRVHSALGVKFWAFVVGAAPLASELEEFWRRMGLAVIQGYGLTETAPIVTLNHPFKKGKQGSVGTPIAGVEVRIADDGEILVRGENVTTGYYVDKSRSPKPTADDVFDADGWLHTGDIGERDSEGRLFIKGRKKEMIVTPEGLNVFPEDVERTLNELPGVRESAVVGVARDGEERVHAVLVLEHGIDADAIVRAANTRLQDHQRIRAASIWPADALPRTEGTRKLKRSAIREWVATGEQPLQTEGGDTLEALIARFAAGRDVGGATTLDDLGLSSLERVELMVAIEDRFQTRIDEARFADARSIDDLKQLVEQGSSPEEVEPPVDFPTWNRAWPVRVVRRLSLGTWILPLARLFAHMRVEGLDHLASLDGPVLFASNHQSHMDVPVILAALPGRWRARMAPAMLKEFFTAHFHPADYTWRQWFTNSLNYYLACFYFNTFPIPQREAGARHTLRYMGELTGGGWSILIFPEGVRGATGDIKPFRGGVGMIASRLEVPVIPVRLDGLDRVLHPTWHMVRPGRVRVAFGAPLRLRGEDYAALAQQVEEQVRSLTPNITIS